MKILFKAKKKYDTDWLTGGKIYDIYRVGYTYCTTDDNGDTYKISSDKKLNASWEIIHANSEEDKFRERLLNS